MLDTNVKLFEFHLPKQDVKSNALVLSGCVANLHQKAEHAIYSELEQWSHVLLNSNDYDKSIQIDFCFCNNYHNMYQKFWARCFSIRTDNGVLYKINGKRTRWNTVTKVNREGEMVLGIKIYLEEGVYNALMEANVILVEGFVALKHKYNTYGIATQLLKRDNKFEVLFADTYKYKRFDNINNFYH